MLTIIDVFSKFVWIIYLNRKTGQEGKGFTPGWTEEVFRISKIALKFPMTYKITDYNGQEIQGSLYEQELQKTAEDTFRIETVLKRQ